MNQFKGVTYLTEDQFRTLSDTGSLEVGGVTYTYMPDERIYVTNSNALTEEDLSTDLQNKINGKQDQLTAGERIVISDNVIKSVTNYIDLSGEDGTLDEDQFTMLQNDDMVVLRRSGIVYRLNSKPINGSGDYIFTSDYFAKPNGTQEASAYIITLKTDKTWSSSIWNYLQIGEQTYASVVEITPSSATNGILSDDDFNNLTTNIDVRIKLNGEYYILMDDQHTTGIVSYIHEGWNGNSNQVKSINITLETKSWTLVVGKNKYYRHYIQLTVGDNTIYYDFSSTDSAAYTATTLPAMPDNTITTLQILAGGCYSSISGLIYRNSLNELKAILHGVYATSPTSVTYLSVNGQDATFVSDTVVAL